MHEDEAVIYSWEKLGAQDRPELKPAVRRERAIQRQEPEKQCAGRA